MKKETGGPAFPNDVKPITERAGMSLRDYFAAKALHAVMVTSKGQTPAYLCQEAYHMADVMLKAREL